MKRSRKPEPQPPDLAPTLALAARSQLAAMMHRLGARGFDGLTPTFASVIPLLDGTGMRTTALAQRAGVTKQAMSQLLRLLEKRNYVEQAPDVSDTRAKVIRLTKRGEALREACAEVRQELTVAAIRALGKTNLSRLQRDLNTLITSLTASSK
jgi:DNA-binding MarR family transcriptional regulator